MLGVITSRLIQLIFNYQLGLVGLDLLQNICEGRGVPRALWKYFNKKNIEKPSQTPKNLIINVIKAKHHTRIISNYSLINSSSS